MNKFRWFSLALVVLLLLNGPLALVAQAQQPQQPATPPAQEPESGELSPGFYSVAAGVATVVNVPGRAVLCVIGTAVGFSVLAITLGSGYRAATRVVEEGCRGPWIITADDVKPGPTESAMGRY